MFRQTQLKNTYFYFLLSIVFLLIFYIVQSTHYSNQSSTKEIEKLSYVIDVQSLNLIHVAENISDIIKINPKNYWEKLDNTLKDKEFTCYIVTKDSVSYWNKSGIDPSSVSGLIIDKNIHCIKLPSGWYIYTGIEKDSNTIYLFDLIKTDYLVNNDLLVPGFTAKYSNNNDIELTLDEDFSQYKIYNQKGQFLLGVASNDSNIESGKTTILIFVLFIFSYIAIIISLYYLIKDTTLIRVSAVTKFTYFVLSSMFIWYIINYFQFPVELRNSSIFNTSISNIPFTLSLGNLIINLIQLVILSIAANNYLGNIKSPTTPLKIIAGYTVLWVFILIIIFVLYSATINQGLSPITETNVQIDFILWRSIILIGLGISLHYVIITFLNTNNKQSIPYLIPFILSFFGLAIIYTLLDIPIFIIITTLALTFFIIILKLFIWEHINDLFFKHLALLIIIASTSSIVINQALKQKKDNYQKYIAQTLSVKNDSIFELAFTKISKPIINDEYLQKIIFIDRNTIDSEIEDYLRYKYFTNDFNKYEIQITNCGNDELIEIQPEGEVVNCSDYFNTLIDEITYPTKDSSLHRFNSGTESNYYISKFSLSDPHNPLNIRNIFIEFVSSHVPEGLGYPELLVDNKSQTLNLSEFSFAKYSNNILTYKFGDFAYNTYFTATNNFRFGSFFPYDDYRHYAVDLSPDTYLIVSRKQTSMVLKIVVFSVIFILFSLLSVIVYLIIYARKAIYQFRLNFKTRLQTFVIATLTITFLLMALSTLFYIEDSNREDLEKQLLEKTNSVLIELQHKLSNVSDLENEDPENLHSLLRKFSLVFFSDINLYDKSGILIATSRPEIFEKSLLSSYINPKAYKAIFFDNKLNFITEEKIGSLNYYSSYVPINLNNDLPIGIVNLPYFARQTEFTKSYYIMLSYLINIYVIIGIIGTLIAIIFSRYLTRPLVLLQNSISNIRIDKHNEKINWNKNDEIGLLITEYNRMVDKLEQSADLLKHSERESAWREVAKQIAHEIKNPLTPMKLNVQYLEKSYNNNDPEFAAKIHSISESLITQIDTLDNVAEMFTNFAKSKSLVFEQVNLRKLLVSAINIFDKKTNVSVKIVFENDKDDLITMGFEKDILRVINNLLKNAIQAVEKNNSGIIEITVIKNPEYIEVAVYDNGKGISDKMKSNIFLPYFTTKTSGTGLGLAIVKNIMSEIGGEVYFKSEINTGTTFYLRFPVIKS